MNRSRLCAVAGLLDRPRRRQNGVTGMFKINLVFAALLLFHPRGLEGQRLLTDDWYDDDEWHLQVRYLMTPPEAATYRAQKTESGRDEFITAFWARRDPTPGTTRNEFREEFDRRVTFANTHFTDPHEAPHLGVDSERGRIHVLFGKPDMNSTFVRGAHEIWQYANDPATGNNLRIDFSIPPIQTCDGSYRILSPKPIGEERSGNTSVQVYPWRFATARIRVDFARTSSIAHTLRTAAGAEVLEGDGAFWDGQIGPAGKDALALHLLDCRLFDTEGWGFTHPLAVGSYVFASVVTALDGSIARETVRFDVK